MRGLRLYSEPDAVRAGMATVLKITREFLFPKPKGFNNSRLVETSAKQAALLPERGYSQVCHYQL